MKKYVRKLHLWLSFPVGIIIFITCLTGAMLVFQEEILHKAHPTHYYVSDVQGDPLLLNELIPLVNTQLTENGVAGVQVFSDPKRTYVMTLKEGFRASAFVNPYTGQVTGYYYFQQSPFYTIMSIHRWLMDGTRTWGKYAVGISTLLFVVILLTGLLIQPSSFFKKCTFIIHRKKGKARLLYDMHNVLGVYACIVLLVCSLTGLMWSFDWYRSGVFKLFGAEPVQTQGRGGGGHGSGSQRNRDSADDKALNVAHWQSVYEELSQHQSGVEYVRIQDRKASVHLKSFPTSRALDVYSFDVRTGKVKGVEYYKDSSKPSKLWGWVYALHVGNFWGIGSKILMFIAALIGASLPVTGYWMYFKKRRRRRRRVAAYDKVTICK